MENLVYVPLIFVSILILIASRALKPKALGASALNPAMWFALYFAIVSVDFFFLSLYPDPAFSFYSVDFANSKALAALIYTGFGLSVLLGIFASYYFRVKSFALSRDFRSSSPSVLLLIVVGLLFFIMVQSAPGAFANIGSIEYAIAQRGLFFSERPVAGLLSYLVLPLYIFVCASYRPDRKHFFVFVSCVALVGIYLTGSRGRIILVLIFMWATMRMSKTEVSMTSIIMGLFLVFPGLAIMQYALRDHVNFSTISEFFESNQGILSLTFNSSHVSFAEVAVVAVHYDYAGWEPMRSFMSSLLSIFPRSVFGWKGFGTSHMFTEIYFPGRIDLTGSQYTVGGVMDMYLTLGWLGIFTFGFGSSIVSLIFAKRAIQGGFNDKALLMIVLVFNYNFLRGDLYNAMLFIWPCFFVGICVNLIYVFSKPYFARSV